MWINACEVPVNTILFYVELFYSNTGETRFALWEHPAKTNCQADADAFLASQGYELGVL